MEKITISTALANSIAIHLRQGGSRLESDPLADRLFDEANAPAREEQTRAQWRAMLDAEIAKVRAQADVLLDAGDEDAGSIMTTGLENTQIGVEVRRGKAPPTA